MLKNVVFIIRNQLYIVKNLRKIIGLFIFIFVAGTTVTIMSIQKKLVKKDTTELVVISKDSAKPLLKSKKTV